MGGSGDEEASRPGGLPLLLGALRGEPIVSYLYSRVPLAAFNFYDPLFSLPLSI